MLKVKKRLEINSTQQTASRKKCVSIDWRWAVRVGWVFISTTKYTSWWLCVNCNQFWVYFSLHHKRRKKKNQVINQVKFECKTTFWGWNFVLVIDIESGNFLRLRKISGFMVRKLEADFTNHWFCNARINFRNFSVDFEHFFAGIHSRRLTSNNGIINELL